MTNKGYYYYYYCYYYSSVKITKNRRAKMQNANVLVDAGRCTVVCSEIRPHIPLHTQW